MPNDDDRSDVNVEDYENIWLRLLHMVIIAVLMSMASSLLGIMTVVQFLIMVFNKREITSHNREKVGRFGKWVFPANPMTSAGQFTAIRLITV